MFYTLKPKINLHFQKALFLIYLLVPIIPLCALQIAKTTGNVNQYGWWLLSVCILFLGIDQLFGKAWDTPTCNRVKHPKKSFYTSFLLFLCLPATMLLSFYGAHFFCNTNELNWAGRIGWVLSLGLAVTGLALPAGHELIHSKARIERIMGGVLFALMCSAAYKIEHIRGHHINVATPADTGSADFNQSFYHFLPHAFKKTFVNAWLIEKKRLNRKGNSALSWRNQLFSWHLISASIASTYYVFWGMNGIIFFLGQGLVAQAGIYVINYIQHYGLKRRQLNDGNYEKFSAGHAWNCNFLISNSVSFHLPRHTDHHLNPACPYPYRHHIEESPQMPMGYFVMFFMALIPPLWFKVMNPRLLAYNSNTLKTRAHNDFNRRASKNPSKSYILQ